MNLTKIMQAVFIIWVMNTVAFSANAMPFSLKPIKAAQSQAIDNGLATIAMIYQPDCPWCKKQGRVLSKAFEQCQSSLNIVLVGTRGNKRQLKQELKHYPKALPSFLASSQFLRDIGGYQASPTTLIYDQSGQLVKKRRGFIPSDKLESVFDMMTNGACQI